MLSNESIPCSSKIIWQQQLIINFNAVETIIIIGTATNASERWNFIEHINVRVMLGKMCVCVYVCWHLASTIQTNIKLGMSANIIDANAIWYMPFECTSHIAMSITIMKFHHRFHIKPVGLVQFILEEPMQSNFYNF